MEVHVRIPLVLVGPIATLWVLSEIPTSAASRGIDIPPGMTWRKVPEIMGKFLVPKSWHFTRAKSSPYTFFVTEEKYSGTGGFETGLTISARKLPPDQSVLTLAEQMVSGGCRDTEQVLPPFSEPFGTMTVMGCIVRLNMDGMSVTVALTEVAGPKRNTLYTFQFRSPTSHWEKAWEFGKHMMETFTLDDDF
jgi:hypothetical protein